MAICKSCKNYKKRFWRKNGTCKITKIIILQPTITHPLGCIHYKSKKAH